MAKTFIIETENKEDAKVFLHWIDKTDIQHNNNTNRYNKIANGEAKYYIFKGSNNTYLGWCFDYSDEYISNNFYQNYHCKEPVRIPLDDFFRVVKYKNNQKDIHRVLCKLEETCKTITGTTTVNPWL